MNRIAIIMGGGIIHDILVEEEVEITIVDLDIEGAEKEDIIEVTQNDGTVAEAFISYPHVYSSDEALKFLDMLERLNKKAEHDHQSSSYRIIIT
jgi:hypothetical protein